MAGLTAAALRVENVAELVIRSLTAAGGRLDRQGFFSPLLEEFDLEKLLDEALQLLEETGQVEVYGRMVCLPKSVPVAALAPEGKKKLTVGVIKAGIIAKSVGGISLED